MEERSNSLPPSRASSRAEIPLTPVKSYLHLTDPIFLHGEWKHSWFDVARQQMLLFKDSTFYLWSPCVIDPGPTFFYTDTSWPAQMLLAKISIDSQLLAIQYSKTSIYVVDVNGGKKWKVDIKYFSGNEILPNGIIWSEHGGNSQDLVIVTARGLELYKISTARGQCKLSRNISIKTHFFWYEPNFRTILVAVTTQNYSLEMTGFFLRYDMSDMPRLELPPPDRMPSFTLGTGAGPQDVKLLTLYGKLYCAVRYAEAAGDHLTLYHITKSKAERVYQFPLHMSSDIMLSVADNILCCHCLHFNVSLLFDIKLLPTISGGTSEVDYLCGACTLTVDTNQIKGSTENDSVSKNSSSSQSASPVIKESFIERMGSSGNPLPRTQSWTGSTTSGHHGDWSDAVGMGGDLGFESLALTSHSTFPPVETSTGVSINTGAFSRSRHNSMSLTPQSPPPKQSKGMITREPMEENFISSKHSENLDEGLTRPTLLSPLKSLSDTIRLTTEPYSGDWQIIFPYWVWIPTTRCLLKIKCNLVAIASSFHDPRKVVNFLALRGNPVIAPRPTFFADYEDSFEAKKILLARLLSSIEDQSLSIQWVNTYIDELIKHYALQYHRRSGEHSHRSEGSRITSEEDLPNEAPLLKNEGSNGSNASPSPGEFKEDVAPPTKPKRRLFHSAKNDCEQNQDSSPQSLYLQSSSNGIPSRKMSVNTQTITTLHNSRLKEQQEKVTSSTPLTHTIPQLEPNLDVRIFFPEIFTIGLKSFGKRVNSETTLPLSAPPPLSITRNEETQLICTQTEIFSFVLLPLALKFVDLCEKTQSSNQNSKIDKLIWFLHGFISSLRAHCIPVTPALSLLVINLLCYQKKFLEIAHTIQLQFLSDSPELAFSILEMSDLIEEEYLLSPAYDITPNQPSMNATELIRSREVRHSLVAIRQAGLDLLWRTQDKVTVVRWMLSHGIVLDAISLCTKIRGQWRSGLTSVSISGLDFFRSAISEVSYIKEIGKLNSTNYTPLKYVGKKSFIRSYPPWRESQSAVNLLNHCATISSHSSINTEDSSSELESIRLELYTTEQQGVHLLQAVHKFLTLWDPSLLSIQKVFFSD